MRKERAFRCWLGGVCLLLLPLSGCGMTDLYLPGQASSRGAMGMPPMTDFGSGMPPPFFNLPPDMNSMQMPPDFQFPGGFPPLPPMP